MLTERFYSLRKTELEDIFSKNQICTIWRGIVRDQLRHFDIPDIYDYYDFNYNIEGHALLIRNNLFNGTYLPSRPLIYRIEKKFGVCRHIVIPQPADALILQIITEFISREVLTNQPSENAFYSRDRHQPKKPHEIDEYGFNWRELWKKMQIKIYRFKEEKDLIIVTDLSNYYDSIYMPELRKIISGYVRNNEVLLDLLFRIIENISWLPDYLPYEGRGLPTTNLEGIRLLAHSFLFELDCILKAKTDDNFTRWMDDIVIGVQDKQEATKTLSSASDVLKSRGLALNLGKTSIYTAKEAEFHFQIEENKYLDSVDSSIFTDNKNKALNSDLGKKFRQHIKTNKGAKYYEKISKRYITSFTRIRSKKLLSDVPRLFNDNPGIRQNLLYYLTSLGYSKRTSVIVLQVLNKLQLYDDISLFNICKLVTDWEIPTNEGGEVFVRAVESEIFGFSEKRRNPFDFYCLVWLKAKYAHPQDLFDFLTKYENIWKSHPFLRRQATAIMARLLPYKEEKVRALLSQQISTSESQVVSVATTILEFEKTSSIRSRVKFYLFPKIKPKVYSLQKFLVLCSFLNSEKVRKDKNIQISVKKYISDPFYKKWIEFQYNIK